MHARKPKNWEQRLVTYAAAIEPGPCTRRGAWRAGIALQASELHVDLGCGKGQFSVQEARAHPDALYIGIDNEELCIAFAAQRAVESGLSNVRFVLADAGDIEEMFAPGEIDVLHLNFPTPFPRKKYAHKRLTYVDRLVAYRELLGSRGELLIKTDSQPFFDFSLIQFDLAAYDVTWLTRDLHAESPSASVTEYERRLSDKGAKIHALRAVVAQRPYTLEQSAELSLMAYLPEDLETLDYIPLGMERAVVNFRNRRRKEAARRARAAEQSENETRWP